MGAPADNPPAIAVPAPIVRSVGSRGTAMGRVVNTATASQKGWDKARGEPRRELLRIDESGRLVLWRIIDYQ